MAAISEDAIRERAYMIWEREGRPHGCDFEHWVRAQVELLAEQTAGNGGGQSPAATARARSARASAGNGKAGTAASVKAATAAKPGATKAAVAKASRPAAARRSAKKPS